MVCTTALANLHIIQHLPFSTVNHRYYHQHMIYQSSWMLQMVKYLFTLSCSYFCSKLMEIIVIEQHYLPTTNVLVKYHILKSQMSNSRRFSSKVVTSILAFSLPLEVNILLQLVFYKNGEKNKLNFSGKKLINLQRI